MAPPYRFVDRDAFARFAGIGIGCQRLQASRVLDIQSGPDHTISDPGLQQGGEGATESHTDGSDGSGSESDRADNDLGSESE